MNRFRTPPASADFSFSQLANQVAALFPSSMLADYMAKAVEKAAYEKMENGRFFATIPGFIGLWAEGRTVETARRELIETLEDWLLLAIQFGDKVPIISGMNLNHRGRHAKARQPA